jgi:DNA repair protein RecO (recombination protein O)
MAYKNRKCIVLKSVNYRDADKIFTLYSQEEGKISAIARGVRKISSKRSGSLDTLNLVNLTYFDNPNGNKTITEVKNLNSFRHLKEDSGKVIAMYGIIKLFLKNVEEEAPDAQLFSALEKTLTVLNNSAVSYLAGLSFFYINFMFRLGYRLQLKKCVICNATLSKEWESAWFSIEKGGLVCPSCKKFEEEIGLKGAALLNKLQVLREEDYRYFRQYSRSLGVIEKILFQYSLLKLQ